MFDAELFSFTATQYWQFASVMLTPTLGFLFLFLLNKPLKKLPFIDTGDDYAPPGWVLPVFAITSLFVASLSISISAFLLLERSHPSDSVFLKTHILEKSPISIPEGEGGLRSANLIIRQYDGYSNLDLFVNGYMVFSTETNCAMQYQCNNNISKLDVPNKYASVVLRYGSMHNLDKVNSLPLEIPIEKYIMDGHNYIDIVLVNSGIGDCSASISASLVFASGAVTKDVSIRPFPSSERPDGDLFYSYGSPRVKLIEPYLTRSADVSYMLCQRLRYSFRIDKI